MSENRCISCGTVIPEGRQVSPECMVKDWKSVSTTPARYIEEMIAVFGAEAVINFCQCYAWIFRSEKEKNAGNAEKALWYMQKAAEIRVLYQKQ